MYDKTTGRHTTNYRNTLIEVAADCPAELAEVPPLRGSHLSIANLQFDKLSAQPYEWSSDDLIFTIEAERKGLTDLVEARKAFFSRGQPCLRSSPLTKRYGWGIHADDEMKIALVARESEQYQALLADASITKVKAMKSRK